MAWTASKLSSSQNAASLVVVVQYTNGVNGATIQETLTTDAATAPPNWPLAVVQQRLLGLNSAPVVTTGAVPADASLSVIANEVTTDPAARGYAGKTPTQIALLMNSSYTPAGAPLISTNVFISQLIWILILLGKWEGIKTAHDSIGATGHADAFKLYELSLIPDYRPDYTQAQFATILNNLVTATLLAASDLNVIRSLILTPQQTNRSFELGLIGVTVAQVANALGTVVS